MNTRKPVDWHLVVPVKGGDRAKSRLHTPPGVRREDLAFAIAADSLAAAASGMPPGRLTVVTSDPRVATFAARLGAQLVADPGIGLNGAVSAGVRALSPQAAVAVLLGDVPALHPADLVAALSAAADHDRALVPDRAGSGTVLLTARRAGDLVPRFGPRSCRRHGQAGHVRLDLDLDRLRCDVDDDSSLRRALALGAGPRTPECLAAAADTLLDMQASVHTFDDETGAGSALLDDGRQVSFTGAVFGSSGLRHLRTGQRVSVVLGESGTDVTRLWIVGIGEGEPIH